DLEAETGYSEHTLLVVALRAELFKTAKHLGSRHQDLLNPLPIPTIALLFTIIAYLLDTWQMGKFNASLQFTEDKYASDTLEMHGLYRIHLEFIGKWANLNTVASTKVREKLFKHVL
ncbi:uncharacterized protein PHACADRAFT_105001, partial [Phanerochaete carnosa HHB-10118-sp]